jgi:cyclic pyranopterin phosphate synthase
MVTHESGARMVDVSEKKATKRRAIASAKVLLNSSTIEALKENRLLKGNPFEVARIAGILAAKKTSELIPLCHQVNLSKVDVRIELCDYGVYLEAEAQAIEKTGVEMEALVAVTIASLTIYDMCKSVQKDISISQVRLELKEGGRSGTFHLTT